MSLSPTSESTPASAGGAHDPKSLERQPTFEVEVQDVVEVIKDKEGRVVDRKFKRVDFIIDAEDEQKTASIPRAKYPPLRNETKAAQMEDVEEARKAGNVPKVDLIRRETLNSLS